MWPNIFKRRRSAYNYKIVFNKPGFFRIKEVIFTDYYPKIMYGMFLVTRDISIDLREYEVQIFILKNGKLKR